MKPEGGERMELSEREFLRVLGSNLAAGRLYRGLTLAQLAARSGYDREELSALESGRHDLRLASAVRLARALDADLPALCSRFFQEHPDRHPFAEAELTVIFGSNVRRLLSEKGLRQTALQARAGLDPSTVSRLLRGKIPNPRMTTLHRIARAVGCELCVLMRRQER